MRFTHSGYHRNSRAIMDGRAVARRGGEDSWVHGAAKCSSEAIRGDDRSNYGVNLSKKQQPSVIGVLGDGGNCENCRRSDGAWASTSFKYKLRTFNFAADDAGTSIDVSATRRNRRMTLECTCGEG